jgi:hypothetical protein
MLPLAARTPLPAALLCRQVSDPVAPRDANIKEKMGLDELSLFSVFQPIKQKA